MDVEAISGPKGLKVIEIDARFPSQTPTVVYHSSGINLIELLFCAFADGVGEIKTFPENKYCIYEHLMLGENGTLVPVGEQVLSMGSDYGKYYEEPGIEILLCKGEKPCIHPGFLGQEQGRSRDEKMKRAFDSEGPFRSCDLKWIKI